MITLYKQLLVVAPVLVESNGGYLNYAAFANFDIM